MSVTVICDSHPRARKAHRCQLCNRVIDPGETYHRQFNIWEDHAYSFKGCEHCTALTRLIDTDPYSEGITADGINDYDPGSITEARWIVYWRGKWRRRDGSLREIPEAPS